MCWMYAWRLSRRTHIQHIKLYNYNDYEEHTMPDKPQFGPLLAEGKTKLIYAYPGDESLAYMVNKDQITAGDGARRNKLAWQTRVGASYTAKRFTLSKQGQYGADLG